MKERSIFSYWWFWALLVGVLLILLAAILHLAFKENTQWVWWIFAAGALLSILGIIFAFVSYFHQPRCVPTTTEETTEKQFGCNKVSNYPSEQYSNNEQYSSPSNNEYSSAMSSPVYSPIGTPSAATHNLPQAQRGFVTSANELSSLAPSM